MAVDVSAVDAGHDIEPSRIEAMQVAAKSRRRAAGGSTSAGGPSPGTATT
jgi:hypothetical protein